MEISKWPVITGLSDHGMVLHMLCNKSKTYEAQASLKSKKIAILGMLVNNKNKDNIMFLGRKFCVYVQV